MGRAPKFTAAGKIAMLISFPPTARLTLRLLRIALLPISLMILFHSVLLAQIEVDARVETIIKDLASNSSDKRRKAAEAAMDLSSKGQPVLEGLATALVKEDVPANKPALIRSIASFGGAAKNALWVLEKELDDEATVQVAVDAIAIIAQQAPYSPELLKLTPRLTALIENGSSTVKFRAIFTLQKIGPTALAAVPILVKATQDPEANIRWVSLATLAVLQAKSKDVTEAAAARLKDPEKKIKSAAAFFMGGLQSGAPEIAARALLLALPDPDNDVAGAMASAIGDLNAEGQQVAIPLLQDIIKSADPTWKKQTAIAALGFIGKSAEPVVPDLLNTLANGAPAESYHAALALAKISTAANVIDALIAATRDPRGQAREGAASALGSIGPIASAKSTTPLIALLKDAVDGVRLAAAEAVGNLGASAKSALPVLITQLNDKDKAAAAKAIGNIDFAVRVCRDDEGQRNQG